MNVSGEKQHLKRLSTVLDFPIHFLSAGKSPMIILFATI